MKKKLALLNHLKNLRERKVRDCMQELSSIHAQLKQCEKNKKLIEEDLEDHEKISIVERSVSPSSQMVWSENYIEYLRKKFDQTQNEMHALSKEIKARQELLKEAINKRKVIERLIEKSYSFEDSQSDGIPYAQSFTSFFFG